MKSKKKTEKPDVTAFIDAVGRVVIGRITNATSTEIEVLNPGVVNIQVQQDNNQLAVQLLPFFFQEFTAASSKENGVHWKFNKNNIVMSTDIELDENIKQQYASIFEGAAPPMQPQKPPQPDLAVTPDQPQPGGPEVVKLFDE